MNLHDKLTEYLEPSEESVMLYDEYEDATKYDLYKNISIIRCKKTLIFKYI